MPNVKHVELSVSATEVTQSSKHQSVLSQIPAVWQKAENNMKIISLASWGAKDCVKINKKNKKNNVASPIRKCKIQLSQAKTLQDQGKKGVENKCPHNQTDLENFCKVVNTVPFESSRRLIRRSNAQRVIAVIQQGTSAIVKLMKR